MIMIENRLFRFNLMPDTIVQGLARNRGCFRTIILTLARNHGATCTIVLTIIRNNLTPDMIVQVTA